MDKRYEKIVVPILEKHKPKSVIKPVVVSPDAPRDANGRVLPIRAFGESEVSDGSLTAVYLPQSLIQKILLKGSNHQRYAMRRALVLVAKNFYRVCNQMPADWYLMYLEQIQNGNRSKKTAKRRERKAWRQAMKKGIKFPKLNLSKIDKFIEHPFYKQFDFANSPAYLELKQEFAAERHETAQDIITDMPMGLRTREDRIQQLLTEKFRGLTPYIPATTEFNERVEEARRTGDLWAFKKWLDAFDINKENKQ
jgi:hypothetical protein